MRKSTLAVVIVAAFVVVVLARQLGRAPAAVPVSGTPAEQAVAKAQAEGRPVVLSFRSKTCKPCVAMAGIVAELRPKYAGRVAIIDVSLDDDSPDGRLIFHHQVRAKPTTVVLNKRGDPVETQVGVWPADELSRRLDDLAGR